MSVNVVTSVAIAVALMGTIAGACKHPRAQKTSATPNNVPNNAVGVNSSTGKSSRDLGTALCAA